MTHPLVTIITPTFNHEKYLSDCIESVLAQTYPHWEMLIVNDGSTDNTQKIAQEYALKDNRIKIFEQMNVGIFRLNETYNFALARANGKYVAVLEGDDVWTKTKLERQVTSIEKDESTVLAWGTANQADVDLNNIGDPSPSKNDLSSQYFCNDPLGSMLNVLFFRNCVPALTLLIRKTILVEIGGFQQGYGLPLVDLPTLQVLCTKGRFYFDDLPLGKWRIYPNQTTKTYITDIYKGFYTLTWNNFQKFSTNSNLSFNVKLKDIENYFKDQLIIAYSRAGRYKLIRNNFTGARQDYLKSILLPGKEYMWKVRSIIGLIFSYLRLNVEGLAKILGRKSYKV